MEARISDADASNEQGPPADSPTAAAAAAAANAAAAGPGAAAGAGAGAAAAGAGGAAAKRPAFQYAGSQSESVLLGSNTTASLGGGTTQTTAHQDGQRGQQQRRQLGPRLLLELDGRAAGEGVGGLSGSPDGKAQLGGLNLEADIKAAAAASRQSAVRASHKLH